MHNIRPYRAGGGTRYEVRVTVHGVQRVQGGFTKLKGEDGAKALREDWLRERHKKPEAKEAPRAEARDRPTLRTLIAEEYFTYLGTLERRTQDDRRRIIDRLIWNDAIGGMDVAQINAE